ncbi:YybH family protein [Luteimonas aquatica]|uniref:YybH family protein n=1 Tax=Luteimonas aquatica TaxID=450364 RepID=UPI001F56EB65|nr:nuclear transport factor 2 family protein [Luteimonas aquatica]
MRRKTDGKWRPAALLATVLLLAGAPWRCVPAADASRKQASGPAPPAMSAAECEVWARERSFARSVADHDAAAFAGHLHPGAVFIGGPQPLRGARAVAEGWAPLIRGEGMRLRWYPEQVVIGGDPDTALSMGPYWLEDARPGADPRYRLGRFISTWKRDGHGTWHVLFDGGGGNAARPATDAEVAALKAALPADCPRG